MQISMLFDALLRLICHSRRTLQPSLPASSGMAAGHVPDSQTAPPARSALPRPRMIGPAGTALIKQFEGCARRQPDGRYKSYPDPATGRLPWTIGWGATGAGIGPGTLWSQSQCDERLGRDLERHAREVDRAIGDASTTEGQFDALVSFHYNTGAIGRATLTRRHCTGDYAGASAEFARWVHAGGRIMPGLVRRRKAKAALYAAN